MRRPWFLFSMLAMGYAFLYGPIVSLIVYSFNKSRLVTVWGGFSGHWYGELLHDEQILSAAWLSLKIAALNATLAVILGLFAGFSLARFGRFQGRGYLTGMVGAPLVMPDVILGLSTLLLFVGMQQLLGWPASRGMATILIAHVTFSSAYVTVIVQSRLVDMDISLEEAAMDLGARPWKVFAQITLPVIAPAIIAGWLLAFTLSLDDLVIASFVSGPGATTLPMVVYSSVRLGVSPVINALACVILLVVSSGIIITGVILHRQELHQNRFRRKQQNG